LSGATLLVRYDPVDQEVGIAEHNRENLRRQALREQQRAAYRVSHPDARRITLSKEQKAQSDWSADRHAVPPTHGVCRASIAAWMRRSPSRRWM